MTEALPPASEDIQAEDHAGVRILTLNRPAKRNALTEDMYAALATEMDEAQRSPAIRAVLLLGAGDSFTAGNDLSAFAGVASASDLAVAAPTHVLRFIHALAMATKPLVAGVHGHAVGIGVTLLLHCDAVVVARNARLAAPFVSLALVPEAASSLLLVERIGYSRAFAMFALGQTLTGATAAEYGIATAAVDAGDVRAEALAIAMRLAALPPQALRATKQLLRRQEAMLAQIEHENVEFLRQLRSVEAREVFTARAERRTPDFAKLAPAPGKDG